MMNRLNAFSLAVATALMILLAAACGSDPLSREVERVAADPSARTEAAYRRIENIVLADPERYAALLTPDGHIDPVRLQKAIDRAGRAENPDFVWDISAYGSPLRGPLRLNLMLERSGSMAGYDSRAGSGSFKRALNELINRFPASDAEPRILIVNDGVYPFKGTTADFMRDKDIFASTAGTGNPQYTDFGRIFSYLLNDTTAENVYVLATDLIYSPHDAEGLTPDKIFNESESLVADIFRRHPSKELAIVRLETDFHGRYYPYTSPSAGVEYNGRRPYFLLVAGSRAAMQELFTAKPYASFTDFASLPGYRGAFRMTREAAEPDFYTVLPRPRGAQGSFVPFGGTAESGAAHSLHDAAPGHDGTIEFEIAADLGATPAPDAYKTDKANYTVKSAGATRLISVKKIEPADINVRNKRYLGRATHLLRLEADRASIGSPVEIRLLNRLPDWDSADSDTNTGAKAFGSSTFGLRPLLEGIYRAMYGTAETPAYSIMHIDIKK